MSHIPDSQLPPKKRKRPDAAGEPPAKKAKRVPGEVRLLSANTCGFDEHKWRNLEKMAVDHDIDLIAIQEGTPKPKVDQIISPEWESTVTSEAPTDLKIGGLTAKPQVGMTRSNVVLVRRDSKVGIMKRSYRPSQSLSVQKFILGNPSTTTTRSGRTVKPRVNEDLVNYLGLRPPQPLELTLEGHQPVSIYNYHAPQGSGSGGPDFSGMDAQKGHEILSRVIKDDSTPYQMVVGDQNAAGNQMRRYYPQHTIITAGGGDPWSHAAVPPGLNPMQIDLGDDGNAFNNKGQPGCSDHQPYAFSFVLPEHK
jgi:hypothetical protein